MPANYELFATVSAQFNDGLSAHGIFWHPLRVVLNRENLKAAAPKELFIKIETTGGRMDRIAYVGL